MSFRVSGPQYGYSAHEIRPAVHKKNCRLALYPKPEGEMHFTLLRATNFAFCFVALPLTSVFIASKKMRISKKSADLVVLDFASHLVRATKKNCYLS